MVVRPGHVLNATYFMMLVWSSSSPGKGSEKQLVLLTVYTAAQTSIRVSHPGIWPHLAVTSGYSASRHHPWAILRIEQILM